MDIDGSYFFSDELDDLVLAPAAEGSPKARSRAPNPEAQAVEGETLPDDVLRLLRSWLGGSTS